MSAALAGGTDASRERVVTLGGGHGQAAVLTALRALDADVTAVVGVADDGGCSGRLSEQFGIPPPGDLRRCLATLAGDRALARRFEERLPGVADDATRSAGNLVLLEAYLRCGSLQGAVDWAADLLDCQGRVSPAAETRGKLSIYDRRAGVLSGESSVDRHGRQPMIAVVHGPEKINEVARLAIEGADLLIIGPGSFITSTLAAVTTAGIAESIARATARRVLIHNLPGEHSDTAPPDLQEHVRLLRDHVLLRGGSDDFSLTVLAHGDAGPRVLPDGTTVVSALVADRPATHDPAALARAFVRHLGLSPRLGLPESAPSRPDALAQFEAHLECAIKRLA